MGKGDKRSKRGKIFKSSFGKKRPRRVKSEAKS
ncbi:MAG: 30S ribosomal protein THX [Fibrobacter sp.]|nr:30S ribosomal protein THX [Fibrobacter sp.]